MDLAQLEAALASYIDNEIVPALDRASTWKKVVIAAVIAQAKSSGFIDVYFDKMASDPAFQSLGIVTEDRKIGDVDTICDSLKTALCSTGPIKVPVLEIQFDESDVDVLRGYLSGKPSPSSVRGRSNHAQTG